jgi:hypothetical protein
LPFVRGISFARQSPSQDDLLPYFFVEELGMLGLFSRLVVVSGIVLALFVASPAMACPFCDGDSSGVNPVWEGIFNQQFWTRAAAVVAPFPILLGVVATIYFGSAGGPRPPRRRDDRERR